MRERIVIEGDQIRRVVFFDDDPREGPDAEFPVADDLGFECAHVAATCCGVTRCLYCRKVMA